MTDRDLERLVEEIQFRSPRLVLGRQKFVLVESAAVLVVMSRVGSGERWSFSPSRDVVRLVEGSLPSSRWFPRPVREWLDRAIRIDFVRHAGAMSARVL